MFPRGVAHRAPPLGLPKRPVHSTTLNGVGDERTPEGDGVNHIILGFLRLWRVSFGKHEQASALPPNGTNPRMPSGLPPESCDPMSIYHRRCWISVIAALLVTFGFQRMKGRRPGPFGSGGRMLWSYLAFPETRSRHASNGMGL